MRIVGVGMGDPDSVPARAVAEVRDAALVFAADVPCAVLDVLGVVDPAPLGAQQPGDDAVVIALDVEAHRLARRFPDAATTPPRDVLRDRAIAASVARLARVGARLRRDCPWDREQRPETILPHTVEEVFEVVEAVTEGDAARVADELGDLLFQVVFLSRFLEEDGTGDLGTVAAAQADKMIERHPHVYGEVVAGDAADVNRSWDARKRAARAEQGIFHEVPRGLPAMAYSAKIQRRAASVGFVFGDVSDAMAQLQEEVGELAAEPGSFELGDVLFAAIAVAQRLGVDAELALRETAVRFRRRLEHASELARADGRRFEDADLDDQLEWYLTARLLEQASSGESPTPGRSGDI